ncbi:hypothetical protein NC651_003518 [Populus alba x Populus x berolinensis]|nr:hypothetical protein NC651_003518 [Populus alba x Populus x berolinensis]
MSSRCETMGGVWCALVGILNSGSQLMISWPHSSL